MENFTTTHDAMNTTFSEQSLCHYGLEVLDFYPPLNCTDVAQCEEDYPCEVRVFWMSIHMFVDLTRALLFYGTSIIITLGVILNGFSFYILQSSGLAKNGSGIYLLILAVCDSGNLLFNYAVGVARGKSSQINGWFMDDEWLCRFHGVIVDIFQLYSAWIVVGFTIERSLIVWYPLALRSSKQNRSRIVVASLGVIFTLFALSKLFLTGFEKNSVFGYTACPSHRFKWNGMAYVGVAFQTWIPTFLVFTCNCIMFFKLRLIRLKRDRLTSRRRKPNGVERNQSFLTRPSSTTPMLIAVSLAYLILVFPLGVVQTFELHWNVRNRMRPTERAPYVDWMTTKILLKFIRSFCFCLYQMNFAVNFFLYFASGIQFRLHLLHKLRSWAHFLRHRSSYKEHMRAKNSQQSTSGKSSASHLQASVL